MISTEKITITPCSRKRDFSIGFEIRSTDTDYFFFQLQLKLVYQSLSSYKHDVVTLFVYFFIIFLQEK